MVLKVVDQDKPLIETERIRSVLHQAPLTLSVTVVNAVLTAIVLAPLGHHLALSTWAAAIIAVSCVRWRIRQHFVSLGDDAKPQFWAAVSIAGSLATGVPGGIGAVVLPPVNEIYQLFFAFVVGGMCAGSTAVNSAHMPSVLAFIGPACLPLAARFLVEGSPPWLVAGLMTMVFAGALSGISLRVHRAFGERVRLELAFGRQERALSEANERLRAEIAERLEAEATLQQSQKMEAIGHLTGGMAHDFNNLLQVMTGNLHMIGRLVDGNTQVLSYVKAAQQAADQGGRLTNGLLAFARRQSLVIERVNLNVLLQEFEPLLLQATDRLVRLTTVLGPDLPACDVTRRSFSPRSSMSSSTPGMRCRRAAGCRSPPGR